MNELIREIEEDIRRERFDELWKNFGKMMVGVSILIVIATAVVEGVQYHKKSQAMEATSTFLKGVDRMHLEDYKGAVQAFSELSNDTSSSYYGLAMLKKAQAEKLMSDNDAAAKTYSALAKTDSVFGSLAALFVPAQDATKNVSKNTPFYFSNAEARGWQLLQQGKKDDAVSQFLALYNEPAVPPSMHARIGEVLRHIAADKMPIETTQPRE